jgi:hypothetical protein
MISMFAYKIGVKVLARVCQETVGGPRFLDLNPDHGPVWSVGPKPTRGLVWGRSDGFGPP